MLTSKRAPVIVIEHCTAVPEKNDAIHPPTLSDHPLCMTLNIFEHSTTYRFCLILSDDNQTVTLRPLQPGLHVFDAGDPPLVFVARSASEAEVWCQHLAAAQLTPTLQRIALIRDELHNVTGHDPFDAGSPDGRDAKQQTESNQEGCRNLLVTHASSKDKANVQLCVSVSNPPYTDWKRVGQTEVIHDYSDPTFLKTIFFRSDLVTDQGQIQFELYDLRDIKSELGIQFGVVRISTEILVSGKLVELRVCDPVTGRVQENPNASGNPLLVVRAQKYESVDSSVDASKERQTRQTTLNLIGSNLLSKRYSFQHILGERMHVAEFMGESKLCFDFPMEYLKALIPREHLLYESLTRTGSSNPKFESFRKERLISMKQTLEQYEAALRHLVDCSGLRFKPSSKRTHPRYDFVPTNLHVNQIALTDESGRIVSSYNITSVGAFSASSRLYKSGGLFRNAVNTVRIPYTSYPPAQLSINRMSHDSPIAATVCLNDTVAEGKAQSLLYQGTRSLALLRGDLQGLVQRLTARDQADPLAERIQRTFTSMLTILKDSLCYETNVTAQVTRDFDNLLKRLTELSSLDKLEGAPPTQMHPLDHTIPKSVSQISTDERLGLLEVIDRAGLQLTSSLDKIWDRTAERLWTIVLAACSNLIRPTSDGAGHPSSSPSSSSTSTGLSEQSGWPSAVMIAEAERVTGKFNALAVDNDLTALSVIHDALSYRHHVCICQALTTVLTALASALPSWDRNRWERVAVCGIMAQFEGLLSCYGNESGMIEDWAWAIGHLARIQIVLRPSGLPSTRTGSTSETKEGARRRPTVSGLTGASGASMPMARMTGVHECELTIPWSVWASAPNKIQACGRVRLRIHPVAFLVGINEQQTIAEKLDKTSLQQAVNYEGLSSVEAYFKRYTKHYAAPPRSASGQDICDLIASVRHIVQPPVKHKPVELLNFAAEITQSFGGLRFTSCKSAKDRTSMSVTLEQIRWLKNAEGMQEDNVNSALQCLRQTGLRLENVYKNTGARKYAFNRIQLLSFPKLYRPPIGTYSMGVPP